MEVKFTAIKWIPFDPNDNSGKIRQLVRVEFGGNKAMADELIGLLKENGYEIH